jgi:hypothetical protein
MARAAQDEAPRSGRISAPLGAEIKPAEDPVQGIPGQISSLFPHLASGKVRNSFWRKGREMKAISIYFRTGTRSGDFGVEKVRNCRGSRIGRKGRRFRHLHAKRPDLFSAPFDDGMSSAKNERTSS